MQCMLGPARKCTAMHRLPLFSFLYSSGGCQSLRIASLDTGRHHRLSWITTGSVMWPPAIGEAIGRERIAGRQSVPAESAIDCNRGQGRAWQYNSRHICTNHVPYHGNDSKEHAPRFSGHQSRISMRDGSRDQVYTFEDKCNAMQQTKPQFLSLDQRTRHAC